MPTFLHTRTGHFLRHYLEMVVAMLAGMAGVLLVDLPDRPAIELVEMAVWMTAPMVGWMRIRGHDWRACREMAAAMLLPAAGALALLATGTVRDGHLLLMWEHSIMFPAMFVAMLLRRDEHVAHHHAAPAA